MKHIKMFDNFKILWFTVTFAVIGVIGIDHSRVVGGRAAIDNEFPYQVSLRLSINDEHFCGGTIIGPKHILTAAHCMFYEWGGRLPTMLVSIVGGQNKLTMNDNSIYRNATKIHVHEEYDNKLQKDDIAIIELDKSLPIDSNRITIAALRNNRIKAGTKCTITGWGVTEFDHQKLPENLLAAEIEIIDFKLCQELNAKANFVLKPGMICAGLEDGSKDACQGDSGGPLFCNGLLTGIVSTGIKCGLPDYAGVYSEVNYYLNWINNII